MAKINKTCEECKELLREAQAYRTLGKVSRRLCRKCFYKWCGLEDGK